MNKSQPINSLKKYKDYVKQFKRPIRYKYEPDMYPCIVVSYDYEDSRSITWFEQEFVYLEDFRGSSEYFS